MVSVLEQVNSILSDIVDDDTVPRNVRDKVRDAVILIQGESGDYDILRDSINEILDGVVHDTNLPFHTRAQIWNAVSILESVEN